MPWTTSRVLCICLVSLLAQVSLASQDAKLLAFDGSAGDTFGDAVSISDGVIAVGARRGNGAHDMTMQTSFQILMIGNSYTQGQSGVPTGGVTEDLQGIFDADPTFNASITERAAGGQTLHGERVVAIERQRNAIGEPSEKLQVTLSERRAARGDRVPHAVLVCGDHVGVALHHHRLTTLVDRVARKVQRVKLTRLGVDGGLRRVHVFGRRVVGPRLRLRQLW